MSLCSTYCDIDISTIPTKVLTLLFKCSQILLSLRKVLCSAKKSLWLGKSRSLKLVSACSAEIDVWKSNLSRRHSDQIFPDISDSKQNFWQCPQLLPGSTDTHCKWSEIGSNRPESILTFIFRSRRLRLVWVLAVSFSGDALLPSSHFQGGQVTCRMWSRRAALTDWWWQLTLCRTAPAKDRLNRSPAGHSTPGNDNIGSTWLVYWRSTQLLIACVSALRGTWRPSKA